MDAAEKQRFIQALVGMSRMRREPTEQYIPPGSEFQPVQELPPPAGWPIFPDRNITPGSDRGLTEEEILTTKWGKDPRMVTEEMKQRAYEAYGLKGKFDPTYPKDKHGRRYQIDHFVPRQMGGADRQDNLWPMPYNPNSLTPPFEQFYVNPNRPWNPWNVLRKDITANRLMKEVKKGNLTLDEAKKQLGGDWRQPYVRFYGQPTFDQGY